MRYKLSLLTLVLFGLTAGSLEAQERTLRGTVTDSVNAAPIAGVSVAVQGTDLGALTNSDGSFVIEDVPSGQVTLRVQRIGYLSKEVAVPAGQNQVQIALTTDYLRVDELVVTGRATTVQRRNVATAVATVSGEEVNEAPAETVEDALQGKVAGAVITNNSGAPGGGLQIRLRGGSSIFASTDPLYVVDGVIMSNDAISNGLNFLTESAGGTSASNQDDPQNRIADLNPEEIESIEILKGATAAAQYGSKASNGVIIITTKKGEVGDPDFRISQQFGFSDLSNTIGARDWTESAARSTFGDAFVDQHFQEGRTFDHEEQLAGRNDLNFETSISASGGDESTSYYTSGLWKENEGIIANTGYEKQSARLNLEQTFGGEFTLNVNTNVIHTNAARGVTNNDNAQVSYYMVLQGTPNFVDLSPDAQGNFPENPSPFIGNGSNPLQTAALTENTEDVWRGIASANMDWRAMSTDNASLQFTGTFGVDAFNQENELFAPPALHFEDFDGLPGTSVLAKSDNVNLNTNLNAIFEISPTDDYTLTTSAGVQFERTDQNIARAFTKNLSAGLPNIDAATQVSLNELSEVTEDFGVFVQEDILAFDERLFASLSVRFDQSSANGNPDDVFTFPSGQVSYRFPDLGDVISEVKVRGAVGTSGNQPLFEQKFQTLSATNNIEGIPGVIPSLEVGDPEIEPEKTLEFEGGVDVTMFQGRARLEATVYRQQIDDLILERSLAPSKGVQTQFFNGGELTSEGVEVSLRGAPVAGENVTWNSTTTFSTNRTIVESLPVPAFFVPAGFGVGADPRVAPDSSLTQLVGPNGDGFGKLGDSSPSFTFGFVNDFSVGNFRLHSLMDWRQGQDVVNLTELLYDFSQNSPDFVAPDPDDLRPVTECDDECSGQERLAGFGAGDHRAYVQDASFLKLRELSLSYQLPESALQVLPGALENLRLSIVGRDLVTVTDYRGLDPEVSNFGNQPAGRSIDVAPFPPSRTFWFTVDATF